jgi:hypothetical protein
MVGFSYVVQAAHTHTVAEITKEVGRLQPSPLFLVRFSSFDECERVSQSRKFRRGYMLNAFVTILLIHICRKEKIALKIAAEV